MGPLGPLPCSQEPATCNYAEPDESTPRRPIQLLLHPLQNQLKLRGFSPQENYTDRATAVCRRG
jgi:hypothetical protein